MFFVPIKNFGEISDFFFLLHFKYALWSKNSGKFYISVEYFHLGYIKNLVRGVAKMALNGIYTL